MLPAVCSTRAPLLLVLFLSLVYIPLAEPATYYFSSSLGKDSRLDEEVIGSEGMRTPWKTLAKASEKLKLAKPGDKFLFRAGDSWSREKLVIPPLPAGLQPITIGAYHLDASKNPWEKEELPIFDGSSTLLAGNFRWQAWEADSHVMVANLKSAVPDNFVVHHVYINNILFVPPRHPNLRNYNDTVAISPSELLGPFFVTSSKQTPAGTYKGDVIRSPKLATLNKPDGYWVGARAVLRDGVHNWQRVSVIGHSNDTLTLSSAVAASLPIYLYLDGVLSELDSPREAWYDNHGKNLYVFPIPGQPIDLVSLVALSANTPAVVEIAKGAKNLVIENIRFEKSIFGIRSGNYEVPSANQPPPSVVPWAGVYDAGTGEGTATSIVDLKAQSIIMGPMDRNPWLNLSPTGVYNVTVRNCVFLRTDYAMTFHNALPNIVVENNDIGWSLAYGVLSEIDPALSKTWSPKDPPFVVVTGNTVHHIGYMSGFGDGVGIQASRVDNNSLWSIGSTAILGNPMVKNVITQNVIFDFGLQSTGYGAIANANPLASDGEKLYAHNIIVNGKGNWGSVGLPIEDEMEEGGATAIYLGFQLRDFYIFNNSLVNVVGRAIAHDGMTNGTVKDNFVLNDVGEGLFLGFKTNTSLGAVQGNTLATRGKKVLLTLGSSHSGNLKSYRAMGYTTKEVFHAFDRGRNLYCSYVEGMTSPAPDQPVFSIEKYEGSILLINFTNWRSETGDTGGSVCSDSELAQIDSQWRAIDGLLSKYRTESVGREQLLHRLLSASRPFGYREALDPSWVPPKTAGPIVYRKGSSITAEDATIASSAAPPSMKCSPLGTVVSLVLASTIARLLVR
ncbi:hypothetical protein CBR_g51992 [Chara braunii]|uniref:Right handed beta helix domain-containing protein n=1 Tax=Chara braunii TaxID=69332 RepID=A0A388K6L5_CHABU|nr:hypothetical protein CBR_g51992 [Chara braunii]|eukprot:GBG65692.1 hypothetical protein CBR_g51992 [Chara braunii]